MTMTAGRARATGYQGYSETLPRTEETVSVARGLVLKACAAWEIGNETAEAAALVLSDLVTNAVNHARGDSLRVIAECPPGDRLYLAVVDMDPSRVPMLRTPGDDDTDGRGLVLVDVLAHRWGCDLLGPARRPNRKRCWAELKVKKAAR
ncbi:ATP-binding protein [Streptomyces sp. CC219B]|uniref:ATP-binding protein n=1 Tax=Streptomyces sp. CC219B TaxID=3044574 RepID=UPI0024A875CD|nr:ATP-binding protein [Streptomyces sp. CC219B]